MEVLRKTILTFLDWELPVNTARLRSNTTLEGRFRTGNTVQRAEGNQRVESANLAAWLTKLTALSN